VKIQRHEELKSTET